MSKNLYQRGEIWWARFKVNNTVYRQSLHTRSEATALKRLKAFRDSIEDEVRFGIGEPTGWPNAVLSWSRAIGQSVKASTYKRYLVSLEQVQPYLDDKTVQQVTVAVIRDLVKGRQRGGATNATIRRDLTAISSVLHHAIDENWIEDNAALSFSRKRIPERRDPIELPREESIKLVVGPFRTRFTDMVLFARETGMREEEIASLEHGSVDLQSKRVTLYRTKRGRVRAVPLSRLAIQIIERQPRFLSSRYVFWHGDGERYKNVSSNFRDYVARAAQRAAQSGVEFHPFRFHDLRHLFAVTYLRKRKGGIYSLQQILGHSSVKTTEIYLDFLTPEEAAYARLHAGDTRDDAKGRRTVLAKDRKV